MRVRSGLIVLLSLCAVPADIGAGPTSTPHDFQTRASFALAVQTSQVLTPGTSRLETTSAFVTYTNEFFRGKTNALKVQFFTEPIGAEAQAKLLSQDDRGMRRGGYAALVLFLDDRDHVASELDLRDSRHDGGENGGFDPCGIDEIFCRLPLRSKPLTAEEQGNVPHPARFEGRSIESVLGRGSQPSGLRPDQEMTLDHRPRARRADGRSPRRASGI